MSFPESEVAVFLLDRGKESRNKAEAISKTYGWSLIDLSEKLNPESFSTSLSGVVPDLKFYAKSFDLGILATRSGMMLKVLASPMHPLIIDLSDTSEYCSRVLGSKNRANGSILRKAMGESMKGRSVDVIDCTAGMARDAWELAYYGFNVTMLETSPILSLLIEDALERAIPGKSVSQSSKVTDSVASRLNFIHVDAEQYLQSKEAQVINSKETVIYIDTMFPEKRGTALPQGGIQTLQKVSKNTDGGEELLRLALAAGYKKVVVKRPRRWHWPEDLSINYSVKGKAIRYDVFVSS